MYCKIIKLYLLLILFLTIAVFGEPNISPVTLEALKPTTNLINLPFDRISNEIPFTLPTDQPPSFGTVVQSWTLNMGGTYQGAGITWRQDSGRFYLLAQRKAVYSFKPEDPAGTYRQEKWNFQTVSGTYDIPYGLVWDPDSHCFWISCIETMYQNACLYRYIYDMVADSWEWAGTPRDSWNITDSLIPWFGGMVKNCNTGYFWFASISIWKLDFYHKTLVGQCETGTGQGIAWIPYDSNYVITSQWNSPYLTERDTFGNILQQNNTYYGYADCEFWDKLLPNPYDTVFLFIIASDANNTLYKVSTGMRWRQLKSGVILEAILSPTTGSYESGSVITPSAVICNWSLTNVSDFFTRFWIFRQSDSLLVYQDLIFTSRLVPFERDTLNFTPFQLSIPPGNYIAKCSIMVIGSPGSAKEVVFSVYVFDVSVLGIVNPPSIVNFGDLIEPQAWVKNFGTVPANFWMMFRITPAYKESCYVFNLPASPPESTQRLISFPVWIAGPPGTRIATCSIMHPRSRKVTKEVRVLVGGDVGITSILMPLDTMYPCSFRPKIRLKNFGAIAQSAICEFLGFDFPGLQIYADTQGINIIEPGDSCDLEFESWQVDTGHYRCFANRFYPPDQIRENDTLSKFFIVIPSPGLLEFKVNLSETRITAIPNPFNNKILFSYTKAYKGPTFLAIYNLEGRIIRNLVKQQQEAGRYKIYWDGKDSEFKDMPAGIYFISWQSGEKTTIKKIIRR